MTEMFWNYIVMMLVQPCEYTRNHWILYFKRMNCRVCEFYLKIVHEKFLPVIVIIFQNKHSLQAYLRKFREFLSDTALAKQV